MATNKEQDGRATGTSLTPGIPVEAGAATDVVSELMSPLPGAEDEDDELLAVEGANRQEVGEGLVGFLQEQARHVADRVALEVQEHPVRSLAVAGMVGFVIASSMKYRSIPAMLRSGAGIAAAMALREIAERGLSRVDTGSA